MHHPDESLEDQQLRKLKTDPVPTVSSQQEAVDEDQSSSMLSAPCDVLLLIFAYLSLKDLMYLGATNKELQRLTLDLRWKEIIKTDNGERSYKFCHYNGPRYNLPDLTEMIVRWSVAQKPALGVIPEIPVKITVFKKLINSKFESCNYQRLDQIVRSGSKLPEALRKRDSFETTKDYFKYLINNVHDLYLALFRNPKLINERDESGQTLLFYPVFAAKKLTKDRVQWIVHILTSVPDADLKIVDNEGNTFLHVTTAYCKEGLKEDILIADDSLNHIIFYQVFLRLLSLLLKTISIFNS